MQMTEAEIVRSYQHALNRTKQISILAELNACSKAEIRDILEKNGEEVPHYGNRYTGKVKEVTEASGSKRKRTSVRMSERRKKKSDSSDLSTRLLKSEEPAGLIKSDESEDVGKCQQEEIAEVVREQGIDFGLSFEHSPEEMLKARSTAPTACQPSDPVDVWKPEVPEEVIAITLMKINDLKLEMGRIQEEMDKLQNELQQRLKMCNRLSVWLDEVKKEGET